MDASSYLIFVHVHPIPEDHDIVQMERAISALAGELLPSYTVEVTAAWVTGFEVVTLGDLDQLPTYSST